MPVGIFRCGRLQKPWAVSSEQNVLDVPTGTPARFLLLDPSPWPFRSASRRIAYRHWLLVAAIVLAFSGLLPVGCSHEQTAVPGARGQALSPGVVVSISLDGDETSETVLIENRGLTIADGSDVYHSRDKWHVAAACLGDTDGNGLVEVLALLDAPDGRHLGLFGYAADGEEGRYRELLVTSVLVPHPVALRVEVVNHATGGPDGNLGNGDLLVLTEEVAAAFEGDGADSKVTTYRWNGFGFTALPPAVE